jgi:hypothetical protein
MTFMISHPTLETFVKHDPYEVRHLLLAGDDPGANSLFQIAAGVRTDVATGTQYEMRKRQDELMQQWSAEGFRHEKQAFEPWHHVLTLLTAMGYLWQAGAGGSTGKTNESRGVIGECAIQCPMPLPLHILQLLLGHPKIVPQFVYESLANLMTHFGLA